jgi:hypothetical protein
MAIMRINRRRLLQNGLDQTLRLGLVGRGLAVTTAPLLDVNHWLTTSAFAAEATLNLKYLKPANFKIIYAILAASLDLRREELTEKAKLDTLLALDNHLEKMSTTTRQDLKLFLDLLEFPIIRMFFGLRSAWEEATPDEMEKFIEGLDHSSISIKRYAYQGLLTLLQVAWYSSESAARSVGYPGPPDSIKPYIESVRETKP